MFAISTAAIVPRVVPIASARAGLVGVHVHLVCGRVSDDEERIAESLQLALELLAHEAVALDDERRAVAELRELLVDRVDAELGARRRLGDRLAGGRRGNAAEDLDEPRAAGVDDACVPQDVEHVLRACERLLAGMHELDEELFDRLRPVGSLGRLRDLPDHRQHRPLDRMAHGAVRGVARAPKRPRERCGVDFALTADDLGESAHDLGEDHTRVTARPHQRGTRELLREPCPVGRGRVLEHVDDRAGREREVGPGVAVRHRVDVEVVDPPAVALERGERAACELERLHPVFTSWMWTSTAATVSPVRRSRSYLTRLRRPEATSARLRPYSTTT